MRIDNNITLRAGAQPGSAAMAGADREREGRKTIYAGNLSRRGETPQDKLAQRKEQAREKAMKIVRDAFCSESEIDEEMEESRQRAGALEADRQILRSEAADLDNRQEVLEGAKENGEISEEEYDSEWKDLQKERLTQEQKLGECEGRIQAENALQRSTRIERQKYRPVQEAWEKADGIMDAARKEAVGMIQQDGLSHLDEEAGKREEKAEEIREDRKAKEELLEKRDEKRREEEVWLEELAPEEVSELMNPSEEAQREVQEMLRKMSLLAEDIKGAAVDENR